MDKLIFLLFLLKSILILYFIYKCSVIIIDKNIRIVYIIIYIFLGCILLFFIIIA